MAARRTFLAGLAAAALAVSAHAAPRTEALIAEIGAALDAGNAVQAQRLADTALAEQGVTALERGRLLLDRGLARELLGASQDAMVDFTAAIETHALPPDERAQALLQRGFLLDGQNKLEDAAKDYSAAITLKTSVLATAYNNRANVYRRQNKLLEARRDYLAALGAGAARPQYPYYGLGQIADAQGDKDAARGFYAKAVASDPGYRLASERLAELGGPPEATLVEPDVIKLRPPEPRPVVKRPAPVSPPPPRRRLAAGPGCGPPWMVLPQPMDRKCSWAPGAASLRPRPAGTGPRTRAGQRWTAMSRISCGLKFQGAACTFGCGVASSDPIRLCASLRSTGLDCVRVRQ